MVVPNPNGIELNRTTTHTHAGTFKLKGAASTEDEGKADAKDSNIKISKTGSEEYEYKKYLKSNLPKPRNSKTPKFISAISSNVTNAGQNVRQGLNRFASSANMATKIIPRPSLSFLTSRKKKEGTQKQRGRRRNYFQKKARARRLNLKKERSTMIQGAGVEEFSNVHSIFSFFISLIHPALVVHAVYNEMDSESSYDYEKYHDFWSWVIQPLTIAAMAISFVLKPCQKSWLYKSVLFIQYILYSFCGPAAQVYLEQEWTVLGFSVRAVVNLLILVFALIIRSKIAMLEKQRLTAFLTLKVLKNGIFSGLGQLVFLMFAAIQCENGSKDVVDGWKGCNRTLYAQTGLGFMVVISLGVQLICGIATEEQRELHMPSSFSSPLVKKTVTMNLSLGESVQIVSLILSALCAMFLLGNYGAKGNFSNEEERSTCFTAIVVGLSSLSIISITKIIGLWQYISKRESQVKFDIKVEKIIMSAESAENSTVEIKVYLDDEQGATSKPAKVEGKILTLPEDDTYSFTKVILDREDLEDFTNITFEVQETSGGTMTDAGKVVVPIADARSTVHPWAFENKAGKCFTSINVIIESFGLGFAEKKKLSEKDKKLLHLDVENPVEEASTMWFVLGVLLTTGQLVTHFASTVTSDKTYETFSIISLPFVTLQYFNSLFCQPKRKSKKYIWALRVHFGTFVLMNEALSCYENFVDGELSKVALHIALAATWTVLFHYGLRLRASIGHRLVGLKGKDLDKFLVETLTKQNMAIVSVMLFLGFRTMKCVVEKDSFEECQSTSKVATAISSLLLFYWLMAIIQGSVEGDWKSDLTLTIPDIATMNPKRVTLLRAAQGMLTFVLFFCGMFLFSMLSVEDKNLTTILVVALVGVIAGTLVVSSEARSLLRRQDEMRKQMKQDEMQRKSFTKKASSDQLQERETKKTETEEERVIRGTVTECSKVFNLVSFLLTSATSSLYALYGLTLEDKYWAIAHTLVPISTVFFGMALVLKGRPPGTKITESEDLEKGDVSKPIEEEEGNKDSQINVGFKVFLHFHFVSAVVVSLVGFGVGHIRNGLLFPGWFCISTIPAWYLAYMQGLKLREAAAKLPEKELSEFLCQTVISNGTSAIQPMIFFSFEAISCFLGQGTFSNGQCYNTSRAALFLSTCITFFTFMSIAVKAVPQVVQEHCAITYAAMSTLDLTWLQKAQCCFIMVTALSSLYLLTVLGVEGEPNDLVAVVGACAGSCSGLAALTCCYSIFRRYEKNIDVVVIHNDLLPKKQADGQIISHGEIRDGMLMGAVT
ncbi:hypothetical protein TrST_g11658 [Triparma strigata]|uniref:Uncharacterized protein n=1 Tax=Triparma strigata TaxID=1606541 RepID=A0A9W7B921_9STRA|nr:hypothetical protein TrST_g11658 [Triparma strigata]